MNCRETVAGRRNFDPIAIAFISAWTHVRLRGQRKYRVLHGGHVTLRNSIDDIADEQIALWMTIRQKGGAVVRHLTHSHVARIISASDGNFFYRHFTHPRQVSSLHTHRTLWIPFVNLRHFTHRSSSLHTPIFVTSHTNTSTLYSFSYHNQRFAV